MNAAEILRTLVAIPTPSSLSNLPLIEWVAQFVEARNWRAQILPYADGNGIAKANLIARPAHAPSADTPSADTPIDLAFVCHTDTVPYAAAWTRALDLHASGESLHGCGACDVKGALACFLAALDTAALDTAALDTAAPTHNNLALILTADEEIGCKGMEVLLAATKLRIRSAIVSEPTSLRPGIAGKGYGLARIRVEGREAHSAFPGEGVSAIAVAARFITRVETLVGRWSEASDAIFDPPRTTVNVGIIDGGTAKNIVAGSCTFLVEWRPVPAEPPRNVLAELQWLADQLHVEEPRARIHIEPLRAEPGFAPAAQGPLLQRLTAVAGQLRTPSGISFGSEASRFAHVAEEVIVIGPGDMHTAHSDRECVPVAELEEWTETIRALLAPR